jgi:hypothetical protein
MKAVIALMIVMAPFISKADDLVSVDQKASALGQIAQANGEWFQVSAKTKLLLTALVSGQKELLRQGVRVTVLKTVCNTGTGESSCNVEISIQDSRGESTVIGIDYSIDKNGTVNGASESMIAG